MADRFGSPLSAPLFSRMTIIGVGLIGSSLLRVARQRNLASHLVAVDASESVCARVREIAIADEVTSDAREGVRGADLVILCTPVGAIEVVARDIAQHLAPGSILSDVVSVKGAVVAGIH